MRGLSPENKLELKRIGINKPLNTELIDTLEQIETEKIDMLLDTSGKPPANQGITSADIERIVNSRMQTIQQPQTQAYQQPRYIIPGTENAYVDDTKGGNYNFEDMKNLANELAAYMRNLLQCDH